jgi:hypothetical protein
MTNEYIQRMKYLGIEPNFFCSEEYFKKADFEEEWNDRAFWYSYEGDIMLPPIISYPEFYESTDKIWLGLDGIDLPKGWIREFFDYEFIYDPRNFLQMSGGDWATFRKNIKKFPKRYDKVVEYYLQEDYSPTDEEITELFISWLNSDKDSGIHDPDIIFEYLLRGRNRAFLVDEEGILLGINCWDYNWKFINFRFCFVDPNYPFLSEYMRYLFYTSEVCLGDKRLVNDGGSLYNESLHRFKLKMNPAEVRKMYSWRKSKPWFAS